MISFLKITIIYIKIDIVYFRYSLQEDMQRITKTLLRNRLLMPLLLIFQMAPVLRYVFTKL